MKRRNVVRTADVFFFSYYMCSVCVCSNVLHTFFHWPKLNHTDDDDDDEEWRCDTNMNYNNNNYSNNVHNSHYPHNNYHCLWICLRMSESIKVSLKQTKKISERREKEWKGDSHTHTFIYSVTQSHILFLFHSQCVHFKNNEKRVLYVCEFFFCMYFKFAKMYPPRAQSDIYKGFYCVMRLCRWFTYNWQAQ